MCFFYSVQVFFQKNAIFFEKSGFFVKMGVILYSKSKEIVK